MQPVVAAQRWGLPAIESVGALAEWLSLTGPELEWFAELKALGNKLHRFKLQHYRYDIVTKRFGGVRLIESPKPRLKELQRLILAGILDRIPTHQAVHGFVKGRSIVTLAASHTGKQVLLRLDLKDFFPAFPAARVQAFFRTLGYPDTVASLLAGICTNAVPRDVWRVLPQGMDPLLWFEARALYTHPHLPQGAPTSPALANLMTYRLDCRLAGLAKSVDAAYTRDADDLAFSGGVEFNRSVERFSTQAAAIALEEGFSVNHRKTRIMRQSVRQQVAGVVVNEKVNVCRRDVDLLEAILTNCVRTGPELQNRERIENFRAHLEGRIGFAGMLNSAKGAKLRALFENIVWRQT